MDTWDEFPAGFFNRQARESGDNGRNVYDFEYYEPGAYGEISLNCLQGQVQ